MFALLAHSAAENLGRPRPSPASVPREAAFRLWLLGFAHSAPAFLHEPSPDPPGAGISPVTPLQVCGWDGPDEGPPPQHLPFPPR